MASDRQRETSQDDQFASASLQGPDFAHFNIKLNIGISLTIETAII
jgi:hypothetical protein